MPKNKYDLSDLGAIPVTENTPLPDQQASPIDLSDLGAQRLPASVEAASTTPGTEPISALKSLGLGAISSANPLATSFAGATGAGLEAYGKMKTGEPQSLEDVLETYRKYRGKAGEALKTAEEQHPTAYRLGGLAGGFVPSGIVGKAGAGTGVLERMLKGAAIGAGAGATYGLGQSKADLTKGEIGSALQDIKGSAILGGILGGGVPAAEGILSTIGKTAGKVAESVPLVQYAKKGFELGTKGEKIAGPETEEKFGKEVLGLSEEAFNKMRDLQRSAGLSQSQALKQLEEQGVQIPAAEKIAAAQEEVNNQLKLKRIEPGPMQQADISKLEDIFKRWGSVKELTPIEAKKLSEELQNQTTLGDKTLQTPQGRKIALGLKRELDESAFKGPEAPAKAVGEAMQKYNTISGAGENIFGASFDALTKEEKEKAIVDFASKIRTSETGETGFKMRQMLDVGLDKLEKIEPEIANKLRQQIPELAEKGKIIKIAGERYKTGFPTPSAMSAKAGNIAGRVISSTSDYIKSSTPESLQQLASTLSNSALAEKLKVAASSPENRRNAVLFSILQNPEYRKTLGVNLTEGD